MNESTWGPADETGRPDSSEQVDPADSAELVAGLRRSLSEAGSADEVVQARHRLLWALIGLHDERWDGESDNVTPELAEAVAHADRLVEETAGHGAASLALEAAGTVYAALAEVTQHAEPRDTALGLLTRALEDVTYVSSDDCVQLLFTVAKLTRARWSDQERVDDPADLDVALGYAHQAWELAGALPDFPALMTLEIRAAIGLMLSDRFLITEPDTPEERQALDGAIAHLSAVIEALPGDPAADELRPDLAWLYWTRFRLAPDGEHSALRVADREATIGVLRGVDNVRARLVRGLALDRRHTATKADEDRDAAIADLRCVLDLSDIDPEDTIALSALIDGGVLMLGRAEDDGDRPDDLDAAIACFERALPLLAREDPERESTLVRLAHAHVVRGGEHPGRERLNTIISCHSEAWPLLRDDPTADDVLRAAVVGELSMARMDRMRRFAVQPGDLDAVIDELTLTRELRWRAFGGEGDTHFAELLGMCHAGRAQEGIGGRTNVSADLARAAELLTYALTRLPADDPTRDEATIALASVALLGVNMNVHGPARLAELTVILRDALVSPPPDRKVHCWFHQALGMALSYQAEPDIDGGIAHIEEAVRLAPTPEDRVLAVFNLANMLIQRFYLRGDLADIDAGTRQIDEMDRADPLLWQMLPSADRLSWRAVRAITRVLQGVSHSRIDHLAPEVDELRAVIAELPADHPQRGRWLSELGMAALVAAKARDDTPGAREALSFLDEAAGSLEGPLREICLLRAGGLRAVTSQGPEFQRDLDTGIAILTELVDSPTVGPRAGGGLGILLIERYRLAGAPADVDQAITRLRDGLRKLQPGHPVRAEMSRRLAEAHRAAGDSPRSTAAGEAALHAWGHNVLLQVGATRAVAAGRSGSGFAQTVACWHLVDGFPEAAVRVLELGRGLVLHAATAGTLISGELRAAGHGDLFAEWDRAKSAERSPAGDDTMAAVLGELIDPSGPQAPDDLRRRVFDALGTTPQGLRLTNPPEVADIAEAVRRTGAEALCYLLPRRSLPGGSTAHGRALLVTADGRVEELPLPELTTDPGGAVAEYADALTGIADPPDSARGEIQRRRWREALDAVCDWAWPAAVGPLLDRFARPGDRPPRLVLVPMGRLGVVPWHAARTAGHYAVEKAVLSYAASGRQLIDAARRPRLDLTTDAVIVSDPTGELTWSNAEARALGRRYPGSRRLARPTAAAGVGIADPETVLAALPSADTPGASLLHLSCHGYGLGSPAESHLRLIRVTDGTVAAAPLTVERILRRAEGRPEAASGGLVVLSACFSDLTVADHDEALTLASAFLAAGAATVVGTRWQIAERAAALLGVVFHHHLTQGHPPPDALRAAQLWMLDPDRTVPGLPPALAALATADDLDLTEVAAWAAFTHQGR